MAFDPGSGAWVTLPQASGGKLCVASCSLSDHILYLAQISNSTVPRAFISAVEHLYIVERLTEHLGGDIEKNPAQWLELRICPTRTCRGECNRRITHPTDSFLIDISTGTCLGSHWAVRCRATARRPTHNLISLDWCMG